MANYGSTITYSGLTLRVTNINAIKVPSTVKQQMGKDVVEIRILGRSVQDWELSVTGLILGDSLSELSTNRAALETADDADVHAYVDGIHDGNYIIVPGSLKFDDKDDTNGSHYNYFMTLKQKQ